LGFGNGVRAFHCWIFKFSNCKIFKSTDGPREGLQQSTAYCGKPDLSHVDVVVGRGRMAKGTPLSVTPDSYRDSRSREQLAEGSKQMCLSYGSCTKKRATV